MNPNAEPLIGLLILLVISVAAWFSRGLRGRGPSLSGPALVLQRFDTRPRGSDALLNLVGRPEGLVGWFLSAVGVDTTTTFSITRDYVHVEQFTLSGQFRHTAPMHGIASTHCGYSMNVALLVVAAVLPIVGITTSAGVRSIVPALLAVLVAAVFVLRFFFSKSLMIAFETSGGLVLGVRFKQGLIENVPVGIDQVTEVVALFDEHLRRATGAAATFSESSPTAVTTHSEQWHYTRGGKRFGPVSGAELRQLAANGRLGPDDLVWKDGMSNWIPAGQHKDLEF